MLENPYQPLPPNPKWPSIALAPAKTLIYKTLLVPNINLNSISADDKQKVRLLNALFVCLFVWALTTIVAIDFRV